MSNCEYSRPFNDDAAIGELDHIAKMYKVAKCRLIAFDRAKTALAKRIPIVPKYWSSNKDVGSCPVCGISICSTYKFCGECGQALKWDKNE